MDDTAQFKLDRLRDDFERITGAPYSFFYCPILFRDEEVDLCKGHLVNKAFEGEHRRWTVQRADVDSFYGSLFEAEFEKIQHQGKTPADSCLFDKDLARKFRPQIRLRGEPVSYYPAGVEVPSEHTAIVFRTSVGAVPLGLKIRPEEVDTTGPQDWEIVVEKDLRLPAIVSLLKAAHLTLFEMLGYRYALSASGHFMGRSILGDFFALNQQNSRDEIISKAKTHFAEFVNMVRPVVVHSPKLDGTIADGHVYVCETATKIPWALIIFVRTSQTIHAVVVPILEHVDAAIRFMSFLKSENCVIEGRFRTFSNGVFSVTQHPMSLAWPGANLGTLGL